MLLACALILSTQLGGSVRTQAVAATSAPARKFVQAFYNWYGPRCLKYVLTKSPMQMILPKRALFEPRLWRALAADFRAQERASGEIVGIDFDPFEGGQDPEDGYQVGAVTKKGPNYWADVYGSMSGKMTHSPCIVAIVTGKDGKWLFENFYYPAQGGVAGEDLLTTLKVLARQRARNHLK